jgi:hypothetical protein
MIEFSIVRQGRSKVCLAGLAGPLSEIASRTFHDLIRCPPHHSVFTLPNSLMPWFQNVVKHTIFAMAFSTCQQATQETMLSVLRAQFCDANDAENDLNKCFLNILEETIHSLTLENMEEFLHLFHNYFYETIDVGHGTDRGTCPDILSPQITVRDVLTCVPRQPWPPPVSYRCPNPFCGA